MTNIISINKHKKAIPTRAIILHPIDPLRRGHMRVLWPAEALAAEKKFSPFLYPKPLSESDLQYLKPLFVVTQQRSDEISWMRSYKKAAIPIICDVDEFLWATDSDVKSRHLSTMMKMFDASDRLVCSTPYIADQLAALGHSARVVPPMIPGRFFRRAKSRFSEKLRIVCPVLADKLFLRRLISMTSDVAEWLFIGENFLDKTPGIPGPDSYEKWMTFIDGLCADLVVLPMALTKQNACRYPSELLEWNAVGVPAICSNVRSMAENRGPIIPLNDPDAWIDVVRELAEHEEIRNALACDSFAGAAFHNLEGHLDMFHDAWAGESFAFKTFNLIPSGGSK